jgi:hypothetical protein
MLVLIPGVFVQDRRRVARHLASVTTARGKDPLGLGATTVRRVALDPTLDDFARHLVDVSRPERIVRVVGRYATVGDPERGKVIEFDEHALRTLLPDTWPPGETINLFDPPWDDVPIARWFLRTVRHEPNSFVAHERNTRSGRHETVEEPAWSFPSTTFVVDYEGPDRYAGVAFTPDLRFFLTAGAGWVRGSARFSPEAFRRMVDFVDRPG